MRWTCGNSPPGAAPVPWACSPSAAPTSSPSPGSWRPGGRARATVTRRLCTIARFYRYAVEEELLDHSPARPRKVRSGKNRSRSPSRGSGSARLAPHQSSASAARRRNTSPGKVLSRGAGAQARSATRRCLRRGPARRAGSGGRSQCPPGSAASWQAYPDTRAGPPVTGRPCRPMPAADRCSAVTPPARHAASSPYELHDAREPPLRAAWGSRSIGQVAVQMGCSARVVAGRRCRRPAGWAVPGAWRGQHSHVRFWAMWAGMVR